MPASTPRTRVIFQNQNLYVGPFGTSGNTATGQHYTGGNVPLGNLVAQLANVQSVTLNVGMNRQDLQTMGQLNRTDQIMIAPPNITLDFNYFVTDGYNETALGLNANGNSFLSGILTKASDSKNYFVSLSQQGVDDNTVTDVNARDCYAVGNGFLSNYTFNAAVGQVATANVSVEGLNVVAYTGSSGAAIPAVNPANSQRISTWNFQLPPGRTITGAGNVFALQPGDVTVEFPNGAGFLVPLSGTNAVNIQSLDISMPISREILNKLGAPLGFSREIQFPLNASLNIRALQTEFQTGGFDTLLCNDSQYNMKIRVKKPGCPGTSRDDAVIWSFNAAKLQSISLGSTIGGDASVDLNLTAQLAGALSTAGVTFSGYYGGQ